ncbi:hypothetical protein G6F22_018040 [Rhizopus arrhizus]|nr:hypothetical protein G6F22_018040 [Rhizopus arrhizus]
MPWEVETYLHRVGRTGRYGTSGIAVNLIGPEDVTFLKVLEERKIQIRPLPDKVSYSEYIKELSAEEQDSLKKYQSVNIEAKPFKHVEKIRKKQQPLKKKIKKISEMEATEINVRIKKAQPKPIFIPPDLFF